MNQEQQQIIQALKQELEHQELDAGDSQWLLAVAVKQYKPDDRTAHLKEQVPTHTARTIVKTNSSPYVDGTDIYLTINPETNQADCESWADIWASYEPLFHGGTEADALKWTREWAEPFYLQLENPHPKIQTR